METVKINILNPKAKNLLQTLADLKLIAFEKPTSLNFAEIVKKIKNNGSNINIDLDEITQEVENIRTNRYES